MTEQRPSQSCPVCETPDGDHLDWCTPQAREQRPSKDLVSERLGKTDIDRLISASERWGHHGVVAWASLMRQSEPIQPLRTAKYYEARNALVLHD
jgi:hypothetical protein